MSVETPKFHKEHDVYGRHTKEMAIARIQPKLFLERHKEFKQPKVERIPYTSVFGQLFKGSPGNVEGFSGKGTVVKAPLFQERLALRIKYAFKDGVGGNPDWSKSAFFQMNFRPISSGGQDLVRRDPTFFISIVPYYKFTSVGAKLYQPPVPLGVLPAAYYHRENIQMVVPQGILSDGDFIIIEDFFRDTSHPEDSGDDVYVIGLDWIVFQTFLGDDDVYMFSGEVQNVAVGASATVTQTVGIDVASPDVFSAKGILRHVEVVASSPPGLSTDFDVEVYADSGYTKLLKAFTANDSTSAPYGLLTREEEIIFLNEDSPINKQLYVKIIENSGNATTFDIRLKGEELK